MAWRAKASSTSRTEATLCLTMLELRVGIALGSTIFLTSTTPSLGSKWREPLLSCLRPAARSRRGPARPRLRPASRPASQLATSGGLGLPFTDRYDRVAARSVDPVAFLGLVGSVLVAATAAT